jgi:hypothetical protein
MLKGLQDIVQVKTDRMIVGVQKLTDTNAIVDSLQKDLEKLAPVLVEKGKETEELLARAAKGIVDIIYIIFFLINFFM